MSHPSVDDIFNAMKNQPASIPVSEEELKKGDIERSKQAYFVPKQLQTIYNNLPEEQKAKYKWYGEEYYSRVIDHAAHDVEMDAKKHYNALRAGLPFSSLTDDEKMVVRKFYGEKWYLELGMTNENE